MDVGIDWNTRTMDFDVSVFEFVWVRIVIVACSQTIPVIICINLKGYYQKQINCHKIKINEL